jgi:hypothetical protein
MAYSHGLPSRAREYNKYLILDPVALVEIGQNDTDADRRLAPSFNEPGWIREEPAKNSGAILARGPRLKWYLTGG